jgi:DNA-binding winged helix-turn-helix (wHTH) protein
VFAVPPTDELQVHGLVIRPRERTVLAQGGPVELTSREFEILLRLSEHPGWVLSPGQLSDGFDEGDFSPESVSVHLSRLRHKLESVGATDVVQTVRGFGYRVRPADDADQVYETEGDGRSLRDASWDLEEAVLQSEHAGTTAQRAAVVEVLKRARCEIYRVLAEPSASLPDDSREPGP